MRGAPKPRYANNNADESHIEYRYAHATNTSSPAPEGRSSHLPSSSHVAEYSSDMEVRPSACSLPDQRNEHPSRLHMMPVDYRRAPRSSMKNGDRTFVPVPSSPRYPPRHMDPPTSPVFSPFKAARTLRGESEDAALTFEHMRNSSDQSGHGSSGHTRRRSESDASKPTYRRVEEAAHYPMGFAANARDSLLSSKSAYPSRFSSATSNRRERSAGHQESPSAGSGGSSPRRHNHGLKLEDGCRRLPAVDFPRPYSPRPSPSSAGVTATPTSDTIIRRGRAVSSAFVHWHMVDVPTVDGRVRKVKVRRSK